jgi:hypothetical protein
MSPFYTLVKNHGKEDWTNCEQLVDVSIDRA